MSEEVKHDKCGRCKTWRLPSLFLNEAGRKLKTCKKCREQAKEERERYKCKHGKQKSICKECGVGHIKKLMYNLVRKKIGNYYDPSISREEYLGIDGKEFLKYINSKLIDGMNWNNHAIVWTIRYTITPHQPYKITDDMTKEQILLVTNYKNIDVRFGVHPLSPHYNPNIDPNTGKYKNKESTV